MLWLSILALIIAIKIPWFGHHYANWWLPFLARQPFIPLSLVIVKYLLVCGPQCTCLLALDLKLDATDRLDQSMAFLQTYHLIKPTAEDMLQQHTTWQPTAPSRKTMAATWLQAKRLARRQS